MDHLEYELIHAITTNNSDELKRLFEEHIIHINEQLEAYKNEGYALLHLASKKNATECLKVLLQEEEINVNTQTTESCCNCLTP